MRDNRNKHQYMIVYKAQESILFTYTLTYLYFPRVTFSASESGLSTAMNGLEVYRISIQHPSLGCSCKHGVLSAT